MQNNNVPQQQDRQGFGSRVSKLEHSKQMQFLTNKPNRIE
jgi:hypothetical protein